MTILEQLRRDEGDKQFPYSDTVGKLTIGIGRNLTDVGLFPEEREYLAKNDIARVDAALQRELPWTLELDEARYGVLQNMCFNLGIKRLLKFKNTLALIQANKFEEAAAAMLQSLWAKQVGPRATRLAEQMKTGRWV